MTKEQLEYIKRFEVQLINRNESRKLWAMMTPEERREVTNKCNELARNYENQE